MARVSIVYITYNRLEFTRITLPALIEKTSVPFDLYLWDNASTDGTKEFLLEFNHPYIKDKILKSYNAGIGEPQDFLWKLGTELVGKMDNDIAPSYHWLERMIKAFDANDKFGAIGAWHAWNRWEDSDLEYKVIGDVAYIPCSHPGGNYIVRQSAVKDKKIPGGNISNRACMSWCTRAESVIEGIRKDGWTNAFVLGVEFTHLLGKEEYYQKVRGDNMEAYLKHLGGTNRSKVLLEQIARLQEMTSFMDSKLGDNGIVTVDRPPETSAT